MEAARTENADMFTAALRRAVNVRPVDAAQSHRTRAGGTQQSPRMAVHWVEEQPPRGPLTVTAAPTVNNVDVLARRSVMGPGPVSRAACLGVLLHLSRVRASGEDAIGRQWSSRVAPSAGGTHAIRPLLMLAEPSGGTTWWRSTGSALQQIDPAGGSLLREDVVGALRGRSVRACIFAVAEPDVLAMRYPEGESLLWRDAGAFAATAQFVALGLNLASCIIGVARELDANARTLPAFVVAAIGLGNTGGVE